MTATTRRHDCAALSAFRIEHSAWQRQGKAKRRIDLDQCAASRDVTLRRGVRRLAPR
jgi:hypothetical protein